MPEMTDRRQAAFGVAIPQAVQTAADIAGQFGRQLRYVVNDPQQTLVETVQESFGGDRISFVFRPAGPGRCVVTITSSGLNVASQFVDEMYRYLPE